MQHIGNGGFSWCASRALQRQAHRVGMGHIMGQRLGDGRLQRLGAIAAFKQPAQCGRDRAQVVAPGGRALQQFTGRRAACVNASVARCWRAARLCATSAWMCAATSIC